jgi:hypothetical protein
MRIDHPDFEHDTRFKSDFADRLDAARLLRKDLQGLAGICDTAKLKPEVQVHIDRLVGWANAYALGLEALQKMSEYAPEKLETVRTHVGAAYDAFLRLEDEGGNVAETPAQVIVHDELAHALRRISRIQKTLEAQLYEPGSVSGTVSGNQN